MSSSTPSSSSTASLQRKRRIGIVGCGSLGQYLIKAIQTDPKISSQLELAFVWNRTSEKLQSLGEILLPKHLQYVYIWKDKIL